MSTRFAFGCVMSSGKKVTRVLNSFVRLAKCSFTSGSAAKRSRVRSVGHMTEVADLNLHSYCTMSG